jgi:uncharacterized protein (TIGR03000 family)
VTTGHHHAAATTTAAPATVIVTLPENAKLTFDGEPTKSTSGTRTFATPALEPGKAFKYTLKAEIPVAGKTEIISREIQVRAGEETKVSLTLPATVAAR